MKLLTILTSLSFAISAQQSQATTYRVMLSGTSFNGIYQESPVNALPDLSIDTENGISAVQSASFRQSLVESCLGTIPTAFNANFYNALSPSGLSYLAFITQENREEIKSILEAFSEWILGIQNLENIIIFETDISPEVAFLETGMLNENEKCMHIKWTNLMPNIEFIVHVKRIED